MQARFLLGPAGSGKTHRCLGEVRALLQREPEGAPLIFLAPKQATFQLERQLLAEGGPAGYTRLHILSFERLAEFIFERLHLPLPELLAEEGRVMVLRALLGARQSELKLFRASARLPGFARQLSGLLRELQRHQLPPALLGRLADESGSDTPLGRKLHDFALLLRAYLEWLDARGLQDADQLLDLATAALRRAASLLTPDSSLRPAALWLDGFAQMTPQEHQLLAAVVPLCGQATLAFCLDGEPATEPAWHSPWALIGQTYLRCREELAALPDVEVVVETLSRDPARRRFAARPALQHLERHWPQPQPFAGSHAEAAAGTQAALRLVACPNPEAEAMLAAREMLRFVRAGGRFRDMAVLVRRLELYHDPVRRVFARYGIPCFLDRREPVAHHPLAELTRSALRTVAFGWQHEDWFGALKSGLVHDGHDAIDHLENEALARGWQGAVWQAELPLENAAPEVRALESLRVRIVPIFRRLEDAVKPAPTGPALADALREFWNALEAGATLETWSRAEFPESGADSAGSVHATVWRQMHDWLDNLALAFPHEALPVTRWLPILEAGLSGLTVGVIPPALDQVLVGAIDRSRNPDLRQVFVLGANEGVFPNVPAPSPLLTEMDRSAMEQLGHPVGPDVRVQLGHERFYGYIACTRARERVTLTWSARDADGAALNPSLFIAHLRRLFPALEVETFAAPATAADAEHPAELVAPLLQALWSDPAESADAPPRLAEPWATLAGLPLFAPVLERVKQWHPLRGREAISQELAARLYGPVLPTSVSRLEQFAACPFRFFVNSGLQAEERKVFELDVRERGSFQHEVLAAFHDELRTEGLKWRELTPEGAAARVARICVRLIPQFQAGMMMASPQNLFAARSYQLALETFVATLVAWMRQYEFDPEAVEMGFGEGEALPPWELDLGSGRRLSLRGRIDRIDLWRSPDGREVRGVVVDYKSSLRKLDPVLLDHGIQQQLPAYLNVLRRLPRAVAEHLFKTSILTPAGVFYINLRGSYPGGASRNEVLDREELARREAYQHQGLFTLAALPQLDNRGVSSGDQFSYRLKKDGQPHARGGGALTPEAFTQLLDDTEAQLQKIGQRIFAGDAAIDPYRKGRETACDSCDYAGVCRIDPWTHSFRVLKAKR